MRIERSTGVIWCALVVWLLFPCLVHAGTPMDEVRSTGDQVLEILNDPKLAAPAAKKEQRDRLRQVIYPRFDFEDMSRRSLGPTWRSISPAEQKEFVQLFTKLLEQAYLNNIQNYHGEKVVYDGETEDQNYARVNTKLVPKDKEPIEVDYNLHKVGADWKVYDVVIDDISIVNNYRAQLSRLLGRDSFAEVLARIREKVAATP